MQGQLLQRVGADPRFLELERKRRTFAWTLTATMVVIYFGFIGLAALAPSVLATPVSGSITLGFVLGFGVIVSAIALTGIYVRRANGEFDRLTAEIVDGALPAMPPVAGMTAAGR